MYLLLLYIIITFFLLIYHNNNNNNIEGNIQSKNITLNFVYNTSKYNNNDNTNFFLTLSKDIEIKDILSKIYEKNKSINIDLMRLNYKNIVFNNNNKLDFYLNLVNKSKNLDKIKDNSIINVTSIVIQNIDLEYKNIYRNKIKDINNIQKKYKDYYKSIKNFTNTDKHIDIIKYDDNILKLFSKKSKPVLNPYNENIYLKKNNEDENKIKTFDIFEYSNPELNDRIINDDINKKYINIDKDKCCTKSKINIENNAILNDKSVFSIFDKSLLYERSQTSDYISINDYNSDYIEYMNIGDNKYKYLVMPALYRTGNISID